MTLGGVKAVVMARPVVREPANRGGLLVACRTDARSKRRISSDISF